MNSQLSQPGHHQPHHHLHSLPHQLHHQQPHGIMAALPQQYQQQHNSYGLPDKVNNMQQKLQQQQNPRFAIDYSDGGPSSPTGSSPARKKGGRPRKYSPSPDGNNIALGLSPTPLLTPISDSAAGGGPATPSSENTSKKLRGRPPTPLKKQLDALGAGGIGFTPHVILVNVGEDIASKLLAFSKQGPRTVCILSAHGAIHNVTLRQPAMGGSTVTYEVRSCALKVTVAEQIV